MIDLQSQGAALARYEVYVDEVPVHGSGGKVISGTRQTVREKVLLTTGPTRIEVGVLDERGIESMRDVRALHGPKRADGDLWFLGLGVSRYANPALNLKYAHKDALDLADRFSKMKGRGFGDTHVRTLVDEQVTVAAVREAKQFFAQSKVNDTVVLFVAGHGTHVRDAGNTQVRRRTWLLSRDRYIDNDLTRRTGAVVLSSSRGSEVSFELDEIENGVFTEELLAALRARSPADANRDGRLTPEEMRQYVSRAVASRTADRQHPTLDRDNRSIRILLPGVGD